jgi:molybdenum cofactor synthesis domain-containing protein
MPRAAEIVIIGNEILSGKVGDDNTAFLVAELRGLGVRLERITVIPDDVAAIGEVVAAAARRASVVLTTGGVGPTLDDVTFEGIARAFGVPLRRSEKMIGVLESFFAGRTTEAHLKMADLPAESELIFSEGLLFPVVLVRNVYIFPGTPQLLRNKFLAIRERFREPPFVLRRVFTTLEEGQIAAALDRVHAAEPGVAIGSYPTFDAHEYAVQITLESKNRAEVERARALLTDLIGAEHVVKVALESDGGSAS